MPRPALLLPSPPTLRGPRTSPSARYPLATPHGLLPPHSTKLPRSRNTKPRIFRTIAAALSSAGATKDISYAVSETVDPKDDHGLVFVAGATGRVGSRTVRELLKLGFRVRAGVRNAQRAESLVQSVRQMHLDPETPKQESEYVEKLEIVECDLEKGEEIGLALGNASVVICCIGASEKEVFDVTGPYRIDYLATKNLIDAATVAKVDHFIMVSSLGTNKVGFPAAILNLFWGVLLWKRKAEEALLASGLPYTIVRPGGMERPTDSFKETHNMRLSQEDTLFGGLVSNLQVAELMAFMAKNRALSYYKVVEAIAETTAPLRPFGELLAEIPSHKEAGSVGNSDVLPASGVASEPSTITVKQEYATGKQEVPSTPTEKELPGNKIVTRPSSPYTVYEDLKPPTSPSPNPPVEPRKAALNSSSRREVPPPVFGNNGP